MLLGGGERNKAAGLSERHGTTEINGITLLRLDEQLKKLRTIGKERCGIEMVRLDENGNDVAEGDVGETCVQTFGMFTEYLKYLREDMGCFQIRWMFQIGDMALRDEDGYWILVGRWGT